MNKSPLHIAIIGAGPIGLEAALRMRSEGHNVTVYERGRLAENVRSWGHIRLFSPFRMNASELGRNALSNVSRVDSPEDDALLTGEEFAQRYLLPLSQLPELRNCIQEHTAVISISRKHHWKGEAIGKPERAADPFQLLLLPANPNHPQRVDMADVVLDCSGVYPHHNWLGAGGMPCPGERQWLTESNYQLPDILETERDWYAEKTTLVVGSGYSAATAVAALAKLHKDHPRTKILWLTRSPRTRPIPQIENDTLTERDHLARTVNALASDHKSPVTWLPERIILKIESHSPGPAHHITVENSAGERESLFVGQVLANVGYRPNRAIYEELQIHECYASQGPIKLAAALLGETSSDCLAQGSHGSDVLKNPEPNFYILGAKSYGRDSRFLINIGLQQIDDVCQLIRTATPAAISASS